MHGLTVSVDLRTDMGQAALLSGAYEPNEMAFVDRYLRPGMVAVDAGANQGWYTLLMAGCVGPRGRVIAVEPSPRERSLLDDNLRANHLGQVTVRVEALGDTDGTITLHLADPEHGGHNTVGGFVYCGVSEAAAITVPRRRLDDVLEQCGISGVDLVKIDVEGAEVGLLAGATNLLRSVRPLLLIEANAASLEAAGTSLSALLAEIRCHDYALCPFDSDTGRPTAHARTLSSNIVAVPAERIPDLVSDGIIDARLPR
jgi:FkbM family methyltransferase